MVSVLLELSIIIIAAILIISILSLLKQPLIIGYIITGLLFSPSFFNVIKETEIISAFSQIGVVLLLFMVGLSLNPKIIKDVGKVSLITGIGQVLFTFIFGFLIAKALSFNFITSLYISIALTFSSTIIITKLLSDKGDIDKLYGKISIGFLIVQDIIAIVILMVISSTSNGSSFTGFAFQTLTTGLLLLLVLGGFSFYILPKLTRKIAKSQEFLLLFSLGWCFLLATIFDALNFSLEIGALLAGISLSLSPYRIEISSKLKPLRDFFIFTFFIWLGSQMSFTNFSSQITPIIVFSFLILIGNPLIVMSLMSFLGYKKQTSFSAGLTVAQISEFSLILIALGVKLGQISPEILSMVTVVGLVTIAGSTYFILYSDKIYSLISPYLSIFERNKLKEKDNFANKKYDLIIFGAHRTGHDLLEQFKDKKESLLVVDYNPERIERLSKKGFNCTYGDISDLDLLDEINLAEAKMIVSTVPDLETNLMFIRKIRKSNPKAIIITVSNKAEEALQMYRKGATYVISPHLIGGKFIADKIKSFGYDTRRYFKEQISQVKELEDISKDI